MPKYLNTKPGSLESAVLEAVSPAQQAAIAISKKEKGEKPKDAKDENNYIYAAKQAKEKGEKTFTIGGKEYDVEETLKTEKLVGGQKKLDKDKDGDIDGDDFAAMRKAKAKKEEVELGEEKVECPQCEGEGCDHCDDKGYHEKMDENMVASLAKEFEKRVKKQGYSSKNQDRERMAVLGMAKKKGASPDDMKKLDKAIVGIINKLDEMKEEVSLAQLAAQHITNMWKESAYGAKKKVDKKEEMDDNEDDGEDGKTMTGKPMSKVEVNPKDKEK